MTLLVIISECFIALFRMIVKNVICETHEFYLRFKFIVTIGHNAIKLLHNINLPKGRTLKRYNLIYHLTQNTQTRIRTIEQKLHIKQ